MARKIADFIPADSEDVYSTRLIDETEEELTAAEEAAKAAIEQLNSTAEKGKTIRINRQIGTGKERMEFIASYPADKFSIDELIELIKDEYGGGDYRFMVYNEKGKLAANKLISIAHKKDPEKASHGGMSDVFLEYMNKQDRMLHELMQKQSGGGDRMEMLQEMLIMKQLFQTEQPAASDPLKQIDSMLAVMDKLKGVNQPEDQESGFGSFMKESIPLLTELVKTTGQTNMNRPQRRHPNPAPQGANKFVQMAAGEILNGLKAGLSADDLAQTMTAKIPDMYIGKLSEFLKHPDTVKMLVSCAPELHGKEEYLTDVVEWSKWIIGEPSKYDIDDSPENLQPTENGDNVAPNENNDIPKSDNSGG